MKEKELLNKNFLKHIELSIITFAIILSLFAFFIFEIMSKSIYLSLDQELKDATRMFEEEQFGIRTELPFELDDNMFKERENLIEDFREKDIARRINNLRLICIVRNEKFEILNSEDLARNYNDYLTNISFDSELIGEIYNLKINNNYNYRAINIKVENGNETKYVQILINADSENKLLQNYETIIIYAVIFGIIISIIASYILSKKTLKPVQIMIEKQTEFVENVSHELRTPLTIIQAKQELLLKNPESKIIDKIEDIDETLKETKRLSKMTNDLMLLTRAESNNLKIDKEETNLDEFITNIVKSFKEIIEFENKKIELDLKYGTYLDIDKDKIRQLFVILLDNAIKYTEEKDTIKIKSYLKDNKCVIELSDTGIGISDDGIKRIFERFYREDKARNRQTGGSGLGLSIAYSIVEAHKGTIKAVHNNPKGTIFIIKIPR